MKRAIQLLTLSLALALTAGACSSSGGGRCSNGVLDPIETDVDCGAFCGPCAGGQRCIAINDCASRDCVEGVCAAAAATCDDGRKNAYETDVDCGGPDCSPCSANKTCVAPTDCASGDCQAGTCALPATCGDAQLSPGESDVDCGGPCLACANGKNCREHAECLSATCTFGVCAAPSCDDGVRNQGEPSVDCGGPCGPCQLGQNCNAPTDCVTSACEGGSCCAANACGFCGESPADVCDGFDNDCDGQTDGVDEVGQGPPCGLQEGICAGATMHCAGEAGWQCDESDYAAHDSRFQAVELSCDGFDNDCDGKTDEGDDIPNQPLCAKQQGVCAGSTAPCRGEAGTSCITQDYADYSDVYEDGAETLCDNLDNDCDGQTDEGLRNSCGACGDQIVELCDGLDNDCDSQTDEAPECAACTATPIVIKDPTFPKQVDAGEWHGAAFRLASGRMCGYFSSNGEDDGGDTTTRAIFFCMDNNTATIFHRVEYNRTETGHSRSFLGATPVGEDIVFYVRDSDTTNDWAWSHEIHRVKTTGAAQEITGSFPAMGADVTVDIASNGESLFVLSAPNYASGNLRLSTMTASGAVTTVQIPGVDVAEAHVMAPHVAGGQPVVVWLEGDFGSSSATFKVWKGGAVVTTLPRSSGDLGDTFVADKQGRLHFADDERSDDLDYHRFAQGGWAHWATNGSGTNLYYPRLALQPNDTPWVIGHQSYPTEQLLLFPLVQSQPQQPASIRSTGVSRADGPTGVIVTDEPRFHVFYSDQRGFWNNDVTDDVKATWGYYMQMCPGISDPQ